MSRILAFQLFNVHLFLYLDLDEINGDTLQSIKIGRKRHSWVIHNFLKIYFGLWIITLELKICGLVHQMVFNDAAICLIVLFCKSVAKKKKKSLDGISKISFVETLEFYNCLSTRIQSERMTFHLLPKKSTREREVL